MTKPLESFGPELLVLLLKAGLSRQELFLPSYNKAVQLKQRLNALRAEMRRRNHDQYRVAARAKLTIRWGKDAQNESERYKDKFQQVEGKWPEEKRNRNGSRRPIPGDSTPVLFILEPHDSQFKDILNEAGISVDETLDLAATTPTSEFDDLLLLDKDKTP